MNLIDHDVTHTTQGWISLEPSKEEKILQDSRFKSQERGGYGTFEGGRQ